MAITRYFVMRHATTESNLKGTVQGLLDIPLAIQGKEEAAEVGAALRGLGITRIYTSPLQRALETALIVASLLSVEVAFVNDFRARNLGEWVGMKHEKINELWSDPNHPFGNDPDFAPPKGESLREMDTRILQATGQILEGDSSEVPLFVMHIVGAGTVIHDITNERSSLKNAEVWEINSLEKTALSVINPKNLSLPAYE